MSDTKEAEISHTENADHNREPDYMKTQQSGISPKR